MVFFPAMKKNFIKIIPKQQQPTSGDLYVLLSTVLTSDYKTLCIKQALRMSGRTGKR
jgi:hypothetical protein